MSCKLREEATVVRWVHGSVSEVSEYCSVLLLV